MRQQKSFNRGSKGALYLVPTPIGNLEDMTFRAIRILKEVDLIAAEDTRQTKKLLNHFEIDTPLTSYYEHNKRESGKRLIQAIEEEEKTIALVSDAGMPAISDPGYDLVVEALAKDISVIPLPGANAALTALVASGLPTDHFYFHGFLPRGKKERKEQLQSLKLLQMPIIFYEAPHRLKETLKAIQEVWGDREIVLSRELTKKFEEFIRGTVNEALQWSEQGEVRGEFCLIVGGAAEHDLTKDDNSWWSHLSVKNHVEFYIEEKGLKSKDAIKKAADDRGVPKRDVYQAYHIETDDA
nr:16S rRNA (cytidine(1402)-2'-O)-methyltransferase [Bacillus sp. Marseille-P3661]